MLLKNLLVAAIPLFATSSSAAALATSNGSSILRCPDLDFVPRYVHVINKGSDVVSRPLIKK